MFHILDFGFWIVIFLMLVLSVFLPMAKQCNTKVSQFKETVRSLNYQAKNPFPGCKIKINGDNVIYTITQKPANFHEEIQRLLDSSEVLNVSVCVSDGLHRIHTNKSELLNRSPIELVIKYKQEYTED